MPQKQPAYIQAKVPQGWTPDAIVGRAETVIDCSVRILYRLFKSQDLDAAILPMKRKRKLNGHQECRGKQAFKRRISERETDYLFFQREFRHIEGETIVGARHKSAVIILVERLTKVIIALKPAGRKARGNEAALEQWFQGIPKHLFKSITFDCGKEFSKWKPLCNRHDGSIYFADPAPFAACFE